MKTHKELGFELKRRDQLLDSFMRAEEPKEAKLLLNEFQLCSKKINELKVQFKEDLTAWNEEEK